MQNVKEAAINDVRYAKRLTRKYKWLIWSSVLIVFFLFVDFGLEAKNITFYAKWAECGQKPVQAGEEYKAVRNYEEAALFRGPLGAIGDEFFCTPIDAERAGYSSSHHQYSFPNLEKERKDPSQPLKVDYK